MPPQSWSFLITVRKLDEVYLRETFFIDNKKLYSAHLRQSRFTCRENNLVGAIHESPAKNITNKTGRFVNRPYKKDRDEKSLSFSHYPKITYNMIQISPPLPSLIMRSRVSESFVRDSSGICSSLV